MPSTRVQLCECLMLTETVELGVLVPYPEEGREARDQRRPSALSQNEKKISFINPLVNTENILKCLAVLT